MAIEAYNFMSFVDIVCNNVSKHTKDELNDEEYNQNDGNKKAHRNKRQKYRKKNQKRKRKIKNIGE